MRIDILTLFPEMCERVLGESIIGRALKNGLAEVHCHNIRDYTLDKQKRVDDSPYGGGMGMVMQADPIWRCCTAVEAQGDPAPIRRIYLSPQGRPFSQQEAVELAACPRLLLLCGHYEGVDERVLEKLEFEEISIGDYVLTGGELPALVLCDAVLRMQEGVLSDKECYTEESHYNGLLEYPHYSRPEVWEGMAVPPMLLTGHHANIAKWRREKSLERTLDKRPDMLETAPLTAKDKLYLEEYRKKKAASSEEE